MGTRHRPGKFTPVVGEKKPYPRKGHFFLLTLSPAHHWWIISTRRFVSPKLSLRSWLPYVMDLVCFGTFALWYFSCLPGLAALLAGHAIVRIYPHNFLVLAFPVALVSIMVPVHIAILRRHRMPQIAEWLWLYVGQIFTWTLFIFGGLLLKLYLDLHGYSFCSYERGDAVYARTHIACPMESGAE